MQITPRAVEVLRLLRRYKFVDRAIVQRRFFPSDRDGSVTREYLRKMVRAGFARRVHAEVADPITTGTAPVYVPTESGCCVLAAQARDPSLFLDCAPNVRAWTSLRHWVCLSSLVLDLESALAAQDVACCPRLFFEHDVINPEATEPRDRFKLYTEVNAGGAGARKLVCVPDAAFELQVGSFSRAFFIEYERGLDTPARVASSKCGGYHGLFESKKFQRHFPGVSDFRVLCVCPSDTWRDALRRAVAKKSGHERWLFATRSALDASSFLCGNVFLGCTGEAKSLLRPPTPAGSGNPEGGGGVARILTG